MAKRKKKIKDNVRMDSINPTKVPKVRKELLDADYLDKLSPEELKWYAQFMDEYVGGNVRKNKSTGRVKSGHLHSTKKLAKDCYDRNNFRNNDIMSVSKANGLLSDIHEAIKEKDGWYVNNASLTEDALISQIDSKYHPELDEELLDDTHTVKSNKSSASDS